MNYRRPQRNSPLPRFWLRKESCHRQPVGVPGDDPTLAAAFRGAQLLSDVFEKNRELPLDLRLLFQDEKNTEALEAFSIHALTSGIS
jgi:hypothetical protein